MPATAAPVHSFVEPPLACCLAFGCRFGSGTSHCLLTWVICCASFWYILLSLLELGQVFGLLSGFGTSLCFLAFAWLACVISSALILEPPLVFCFAFCCFSALEPHCLLAFAWAARVIWSAIILERSALRRGEEGRREQDTTGEERRGEENAGE